MQAQKEPAHDEPSVVEAAEALVQRFLGVKRDIEKHRSNSSPLPSRKETQEVTLVVVTKTYPLACIRPLLSHGHRHFGENRVQEASGKWQGVRDEYPDLRLHAVGALQSKKAEQAVRLFDVIHSLDRPRLAYALAEAMAKLSKPVPCFVQVNLASERQKAGVAIEDLKEFLQLCREQCALPVIGLMCLPPLGEVPAPYFALLAKLAKEHTKEHAPPQLSMGMSADYAEALVFGATHLRIGTAVMGARTTTPPSTTSSA